MEEQIEEAANTLYLETNGLLRSHVTTLADEIKRLRAERAELLDDLEMVEASLHAIRDGA